MNTKAPSARDIVKSRLTPRTRLRARLEGLIERLPRWALPVRLMPGAGIDVLHAGRGEYRALSAEPRFTVDCGPQPLLSGWYLVETVLSHNNGSRQAGLVASVVAVSGVDAVEHPTPVVLSGQGGVSEVFWLPQHVAALDWVPTGAEGFFTQAPLLLHRIGALESRLRRLGRVLDDLRRQRRLAPARRAGLRWIDAFCNLPHAYQCSAVLHNTLGQAGEPDGTVADEAYRAFIALNENVGRRQLATMRKQAAAGPVLTLTLMMPVEQPNHRHFGAALDAVLAQVYPHWELLLVGDFTADSQAEAMAAVYRAKDDRIKVLACGPEVGEAAPLNQALLVASGAFAGVLDQHDQLPPHALFMMASKLAGDPGLALLYSDHDSLNRHGVRQRPHFKPDWNPDLFHSQHYLGKLTLFRPEAALLLGGYRADYNGAASYDMLLRYVRSLPARAVGHIPAVLCHTRGRPHPDRHEAGKRALADVLGASALGVEDGARPGLYRVRRAAPGAAPLVTIIIPTRDRIDILKTCIDSIVQRTAYTNWELLVIDNQSAETASLVYFAALQADPRIRVLRDESPFNYSALNNLAVRNANGTVLALLNNDVEVIDPDWLDEMVSHALRPEIGAVGAKLLYANGTVQHAGVVLGIGWVAGHAHKSLAGDAPGYTQRAVLTQNMSAVTGACLVVRKSAYLEVGGLNETALAVAFNDIDFCLKLTAAGYRNLFTPFARLYHHESISRGQDDTPAKRGQLQREYDYMRNTWGQRLRRDPAYSPNLTQQYEDFSVRQNRIRS